MDDSEQRAADKTESQNTLLKWILGGVAAGIVGIAAFVSATFNTFITREEAHQNFLRQDMKVAMEHLSNVIEKQADQDDAIIKAIDNQTRSIDNQTRMIEGLRDDTRQGVWRSAPIPGTSTTKQ